MQFGIFTVGDVTTDPTTGRTPTEHERIKAPVDDRQEGRGGRARRRRDRASTTTRPSSPPPPRPRWRYIAAQTERIILSTATTLITTTDPVRIAEDYATLQHLTDGRMDLMLGPRQHRPGLPVVRQGHPRRHRAGRRELRAAAPAVARGGRRLGGPVPHAAAGLHRHPAAAGRRAAVRVARLDPQPGDRRAGRLLRRRLLRQPHLLAGRAHRSGWSTSTARRFEHYGHGTRRPGHRRPRRAGVHAHEQPGRRPGVPAVLRQRPGLRPRPVAGGVHRETAADRRLPAAGHRAHPRRSASTSATTSASCS